MVNPNLPAGQQAVTYPSPNEWPITYRVITGISRERYAVITAPDHGFTYTSGEPRIQVDFTQVKGMFQINGKFAYVKEIINTNQFSIDLDSTNYHAYTSGGYVNILQGPYPINPLTNTFA